MKKIEIEIVKAQDSLPKGTKKTVNSVFALDLVNRGIAKFANPEDEERHNERLKFNADQVNNAAKSNKKKTAARNDGSDHAKKMVLARRRGILEQYDEFTDAREKEFHLDIDTTKEEFAVMLDASKKAKEDFEEAAQKIIDLFNERKEHLSGLGEVVDITLFTVDTTDEEYNEMVANAEKIVKTETPKAPAKKPVAKKKAAKKKPVAKKKAAKKKPVAKK